MPNEAFPANLQRPAELLGGRRSHRHGRHQSGGPRQRRQPSSARSSTTTPAQSSSAAGSAASASSTCSAASTCPASPGALHPPLAFPRSSSRQSPSIPGGGSPGHPESGRRDAAAGLQVAGIDSDLDRWRQMVKRFRGATEPATSCRSVQDAAKRAFIIVETRKNWEEPRDNGAEPADRVSRL
jgi:hypothetical protein